MVEPSPRRALESPGQAQLRRVVSPRVVARRLRRGLTVLVTSVALILTVLGFASTDTATAADPRAGIEVSLKADRSKPAQLASRTVRGKIYVFVRNARGLKKVSFYIDRKQGSKPVRTESARPFDLGSTARNGSARSYDTKKLSEGRHTLTAVLKWSNGTTTTRRATFTVDNVRGAKPKPKPKPKPAGKVCTDPVWRSSSNGAMRSDGDFIIHNNGWNTSGYRVKGTVEVCNYRSWNAIVTADNSAKDGAVKTYPNVHQDYHDWSTGYEPPLSRYKTLSSTFAARGPNTGIYNIAYDIWLNGVGNGGGSNREVMIWTDNQKQRPAGSVVAKGLKFGGQTWTLWATSDNHILSFVPAKDMASGTVNIRAMLDYLISRKRVPAKSTLGQICYGVEVVSTNGSPGKFNFTNFSLNDG